MKEVEKYFFRPILNGTTVLEGSGIAIIVGKGDRQTSEDRAELEYFTYEDKSLYFRINTVNLNKLEETLNPLDKFNDEFKHYLVSQAFEEHPDSTSHRLIRRMVTDGVKYGIRKYL